MPSQGCDTRLWVQVSYSSPRCLLGEGLSTGHPCHTCLRGPPLSPRTCKPFLSCWPSTWLNRGPSRSWERSWLRWSQDNQVDPCNLSRIKLANFLAFLSTHLYLSACLSRSIMQLFALLSVNSAFHLSLMTASFGTWFVLSQIRDARNPRRTQAKTSISCSRCIHINQPTNQPAKKQPIKHSTNYLTDQPLTQPANQSTHQSTNPWTAGSLRCCPR